MSNREIAESAAREIHIKYCKYSHRNAGCVREIETDAAIILRAIEESQQPLVVGEPCPTCRLKYLGEMGDGDYSCAGCGMGMAEPCEHWKQTLEESQGQQEPGERTDSDYAIEFGGYLADAVMQYLKARNAFDEKESTQGCDEGDADLLNDCRRALINAVGEFRKRAERAKGGSDTRELREALKAIRDVSCGEVQLDSCHDDTEALAWIFKQCERVLAQGEPRS